MTRKSWSDEQLSGFLDGELPEQDMKALARDVESDQALAARMARLSSANTAYIDVIGEIDGAPMAVGLKNAIETPPADNVIAFRPRGALAFVLEHRAIAASLVCAAAVWGLMSAVSTEGTSSPFAPGPDGIVLAGSPLLQLLESAPTGEASTVGPISAAARLTFMADDGTFCRQFEVSAGEGMSAAIACREDQTWRTQVVAYGLTKPVGDFQTASASRAPALEAFLNERLSGAPMNAEEEGQLLRNGWVRPKR